MAKKLAQQRETRKVQKARKRRYIEEQQRRRDQECLRRELDEAIEDTVRRVVETVLQKGVTDLLGREKGKRREAEDLTIVEACCNKCRTHYRSLFYRGGFYKRSLLTSDVWVEIKVPRVSCVCGGMVDFETGCVAPYQRVWFDVEQRGRELAGICVSLRDAVRILSWGNRQPLAIATINRMVNRVAELADVFRAEYIEYVPAVVMLDGIWVKTLEPTGEEYVDKAGRCRQRTRLKKFPLLVAYGVDPVSGKRWVLDWEQGRGEDEESWRKLLERLVERGVSAERGLELLVHDGSAGLDQALGMVHFGVGVERQRCIFHKLRNVARDVTGEEGMSRKERQERRREVLADASDVYRGKDESEVRRRLGAFRGKWVDKEPKAVATLERGFDATLVYLKVREKARLRGLEYRVECLRATSALERVQRHFREKARQVVIFHSDKGVAAAVQLVISHHNLDGRHTEDWTHILEEALLAA